MSAARRALSSSLLPRSAALLLSLVVAATASACAGGLDVHTAADAGLMPSATVASVGQDAFASASHPRAERRGEEAAAESLRHDETDGIAPSITVSTTRAPARVEIEARHADSLAVRLTQLTVGEALAYLSGGRLSLDPDVTRHVARATEPDAVDGTHTFDLHHIAEAGTGLFALDVEASDAEAEAHVHTLLQLSPLHLGVDLVGDGVRVRLADQDGEAVSAARIELMDADGRLLGEAVTDPSGRCTVSPTTGAHRLAPALMGEQRFVVARHGNFRALALLD